MDESIIKRVRRIEVKARGLSQQLFSGEWHSAFKGRGMVFSEVREYQYGDDVRSIDWNVTARLARPYVKVFEEERELTVMLVVDVSGSGIFGTEGRLKEELAAEVAATLAFSAMANNDKVGLILFSDRIELFVPPRKGRNHVLRIIKELIGFHPEGHGTNVGLALEFFTQVMRRRCTMIVLSDFIGVASGKDNERKDGEWTRSLRMSSRRHDVVALRLVDRGERRLSIVGLVKLFDPESGSTVWVDTGKKGVRRMAEERFAEHERNVDETLRRYGVDVAVLTTGEDYVVPLRRLFEARGVR